MPHTVSIRFRTGWETDGRPRYDNPPISYRARVVGKGLALREETGFELTNMMTVYLDVQEVLPVDCQLILPPEFAAAPPPVIFTMNYVTDEDGLHHVAIQCGWRYHGQRSF